MKFKKCSLFLALSFALAALPLHAQRITGANNVRTALPEAPQPAAPVFVASNVSSLFQPLRKMGDTNPPPVAPRLAKYIQHGQQAVKLSAADKLQMATLGQLTPFAFGTEILAAGWEHLLDSNPRYGSDSAGFGERLGAAVIRQSSQSIFSTGIAASLLHQDPRYYRKGSGSIANRILYAASRVLVTRTDAGNPAPNYSQMIGYAGASALTMTYYPAVSATWGQTAEGYITSMATSALGNQVYEFAPDALRLIFHRHQK